MQEEIAEEVVGVANRKLGEDVNVTFQVSTNVVTWYLSWFFVIKQDSNVRGFVSSKSMEYVSQKLLKRLHDYNALRVQNFVSFLSHVHIHHSYMFLLSKHY